MKQYDAIVIGSGQAGTPLSKKLAEAGLKTALIEQRWVGGTCINDGCSPTKAMIASAKAFWQASFNEKLGVTAKDVDFDFSKVVKRKDDIVQMMRGNSEKGVRETDNLDLIFGKAFFSGKKELTVKQETGETLTIAADKIFINTGLRPMIPEIEGIDSIEYLTSTTILDIEQVPEHLLVLGGGYISLEFGQMFRRFGSKVTILEESERILKREDPDVTDEITEILSKEDIEILTKTEIVSVTKGKSDFIATLKNNSTERQLHFTHLLIAAGRIPNTDELHLELAGVDTDKHGFVKVNEKLETSVEGIYALGDVKGGPAFTHVSFDDYRIVTKNLIEKLDVTTTDRLIPYTIFTDPQLGRVGITEQEAKAQGHDFEVYRIKNDSVARSIETGDERGMMKAIIDKKTGKLLGAAILAEQGGEIITILQMAMWGGITFEQIRDGIISHPTYAESLNNLFMQ